MPFQSPSLWLPAVASVWLRPRPPTLTWLHHLRSQQVLVSVQAGHPPAWLRSQSSRVVAGVWRHLPCTLPEEHWHWWWLVLNMGQGCNLPLGDWHQFWLCTRAQSPCSKPSCCSFSKATQILIWSQILGHVGYSFGWGLLSPAHLLKLGLHTAVAQDWSHNCCNCPVASLLVPLMLRLPSFMDGLLTCFTPQGVRYY